MDKKSKILFLVFFLVLAGSIFLTYYRYMVVKDYIIETQVSCDPMVESCFIYVCDPENGEECTGDLEQDTSYYKLLHRNAKNIPLCDPAAGEGIACSNPGDFEIEDEEIDGEGMKEEVPSGVEGE